MPASGNARLWLWGLMLVTLGGCFSFQASDVVLDRRILSITAEPPELIVGVSDLSQPVQFNALVVDPKDEGAPQAFTWSWCLSDFGTPGNYDLVAARCIENSASLIAQGSVPLSQLGASLSLADPIALLTNLVQSSGLPSDIVPQGAGAADGGTSTASGGLPTSVQGLSTYLMGQLQVAGDAAASNQPLYGVKRVVVSTPGPGDRQPNHNPHLITLLFDSAPWDAETPLAVKVKSCTPDHETQVNAADGSGTQVTVCEHRVTPVFDPSQDETYPVETTQQDANGNFEVITITERLRFGWETDTGTFTTGSTSQPTDLTPTSVDPLSTFWVEPPTVTNTTVNLWVIVRDGRGGESWETRQLTLSE